MDAAKHAKRRNHLEACRQSLQRKLARVEAQIGAVKQQVLDTQRRIAALTIDPPRAA